MMPKISLRARTEYEAVAAGLEAAGVVQGSMFGMPCLKIEKKMPRRDVRRRDDVQAAG